MFPSLSRAHGFLLIFLFYLPRLKKTNNNSDKNTGDIVVWISTRQTRSRQVDCVWKVRSRGKRQHGRCARWNDKAARQFLSSLPMNPLGDGSMSCRRRWNRKLCARFLFTLPVRDFVIEKKRWARVTSVTSGSLFYFFRLVFILRSIVFNLAATPPTKKKTELELLKIQLSSLRGPLMCLSVENFGVSSASAHARTPRFIVPFALLYNS